LILAGTKALQGKSQKAAYYQPAIRGDPHSIISIWIAKKKTKESVAGKLKEELKKVFAAVSF
jgi:hypothetical protein